MCQFCLIVHIAGKCFVVWLSVYFIQEYWKFYSGTLRRLESLDLECFKFKINKRYSLSCKI